MSKEVMYGEVTNILYWQDREPNYEEYVSHNVARVDFVHMPLRVWPSHTKRDKLVIARANTLIHAGILINEVMRINDRHDCTDTTVVVGGALEEECVLARAQFLREFGVKQVIIDSALCVSMR